MSKNREDKRDWRDGLSVRERNSYMLEQSIGTDCNFVVGPENGGTKEFKAHRFLLCNASVVFEKMLTGEMIEAKTGHVRVTDLSPNTFHLLLRFVYADEAEMSTFEEARDVALAAVKYQMKLLLEKSLSSMRDHVTPENIWSALKFLRLLPHEPLKQTCIKMLQENTRKCVDAEEFLQADEEDVALLLEQDVLNVMNELVLVTAAVKWARHEAEKRGVPTTDESVRAVLEPRLLSLLRLLTIPPAKFAQTCERFTLFTTDEKWVISECMLTQDYRKVPKYLSASLVLRKPPTSVFYCQREVLSTLSNIEYYYSNKNTLLFRVESDVDLKLLGFQIPSEILNDATKLVSTEHSYEEDFDIEVSSCGSSLLSRMVKEENLLTFVFKERVAYNSTTTIFFPQPVVLNNETWFKIVACTIGLYPNAQLATEVVCHDIPNCVTFNFHTVQLKNHINSKNDGLFRGLIFSL